MSINVINIEHDDELDINRAKTRKKPHRVKFNFKLSVTISVSLVIASIWTVLSHINTPTDSANRKPILCSVDEIRSSSESEDIDKTIYTLSMQDNEEDETFYCTFDTYLAISLSTTSVLIPLKGASKKTWQNETKTQFTYEEQLTNDLIYEASKALNIDLSCVNYLRIFSVYVSEKEWQYILSPGQREPVEDDFFENKKISPLSIKLGDDADKNLEELDMVLKCIF